MHWKLSQTPARRFPKSSASAPSESTSIFRECRIGPQNRVKDAAQRNRRWNGPPFPRAVPGLVFNRCYADFQCGGVPYLQQCMSFLPLVTAGMLRYQEVLPEAPSGPASISSGLYSRDSSFPNVDRQTIPGSTRLLLRRTGSPRECQVDQV